MTGELWASVVAFIALAIFGAVTVIMHIIYHNRRYDKLDSSHVHLAAEMSAFDAQLKEQYVGIMTSVEDASRAQAEMIRTMAAGMAAQDEANRAAFEESRERAEALHAMIEQRMSDLSVDLERLRDEAVTGIRLADEHLGQFHRDFTESKVRMVPIPQREQQPVTERSQVSDEQMQKLVSWAKVREEAAARRAREQALAEAQEAQRPAAKPPPQKREASGSMTEFDRVLRSMKGEPE